MRAAIYARKSTNDNDRNQENKSIARQIEHARKYAKNKGWSVREEDVFYDDGVSGAEFHKRPGLGRLLGKLGSIDAVVMSEISRLGRDIIRNAVAIDEIRSEGVRIFYYLSDEEEKADTPEQKLMVTLKSFAAEVERTRTAQRTRDALERKARNGHSTGGSCFGYETVPFESTNASGETVRSHVEYRINEEEAEIVRGVFRMYSDGYGQGAIAKTLNGEPRHNQESNRYFDGKRPLSPQNGTNSWCPSCIREMLHRTRYIGKIKYGQYRNVSARGRARNRVKQKECIIVDQPELRIIPQGLWLKVQDRLKAVRATYTKKNNGSLGGRPRTGRISKYLLSSGFARCETCGGNIVVVGGPHRKYLYYACSYHLNRGSAVCDNDHRERMEWIDTAVLDAIERTALTPSAVKYVVNKAVDIVEERLRQEVDVPTLKARLKTQRKELRNYLKLIAEGKAPESVLHEIECRERCISRPGE